MQEDAGRTRKLRVPNNMLNNFSRKFSIVENDWLVLDVAGACIAPGNICT